VKSAKVGDECFHPGWEAEGAHFRVVRLSKHKSWGVSVRIRVQPVNGLPYYRAWSVGSWLDFVERAAIAKATPTTPQEGA
jgi:hypothetical protein